MSASARLRCAGPGPYTGRLGAFSPIEYKKRTSRIIIRAVKYGGVRSESAVKLSEAKWSFERRQKVELIKIR